MFFDNITENPTGCTTLEKFSQPCKFPFTYNSIKHYSCASDNKEGSWCSTKTDQNGNYLKGYYGLCNVDCLKD